MPGADPCRIDVPQGRCTAGCITSRRCEMHALYPPYALLVCHNTVLLAFAPPPCAPPAHPAVRNRHEYDARVAPVPTAALFAHKWLALLVCRFWGCWMVGWGRTFVPAVAQARVRRDGQRQAARAHAHQVSRAASARGRHQHRLRFSGCRSAASSKPLKHPASLWGCGSERRSGCQRACEDPV